jgi:hypothetical protein
LEASLHCKGTDTSDGIILAVDDDSKCIDSVNLCKLCLCQLRQYLVVKSSGNPFVIYFGCWHCLGVSLHSSSLCIFDVIEIHVIGRYLNRESLFCNLFTRLI